MWQLCDMRFGQLQATIGEYIVEIFRGDPKAVGIDVLDAVVSSRMGIYETRGIEGNLLRLRELVTDDEVLCLPTSEYFGEIGELRFVRLGPPLDDDDICYSELTTPYILEGASAAEWTRYLKASMPDPSGDEREQLAAVFKADTAAMPWHDFVFDGYFQASQNAIVLSGIPDKPETLPHYIPPDRELADRVAEREAIADEAELPCEHETSFEMKLNYTQRKVIAEMLPALAERVAPKSKGKHTIQFSEPEIEELGNVAEIWLVSARGSQIPTLRKLIDMVNGAVDAAAREKFGENAGLANRMYCLRIDLNDTNLAPYPSYRLHARTAAFCDSDCHGLDGFTSA